MNVDVQDLLHTYLDRFPEDANGLKSLQDLLDSNVNVTSRKESRGHVTCGAIVLNSSGDVLMVHHKVLDRWLLPGGHLEDGDASLRDAALREMVEETGLSAESMEPWGNWLDVVPLHIDAHVIPDNDRKREPEHTHFDFRFAFKSRGGPLRIQEAEVSGAEWASLSKAPSTLRSRLEAMNALRK